MFRTAAAIVKVMGGVTDQPLLSREQMVVKETDNGGIIVVGSHTDKTTKQVEELKKLTDIEFIELDATLVKDDEAFEKEVKDVWIWKKHASRQERRSAAIRQEH